MATADEIQSQWNTYGSNRLDDKYRELWQGADAYNKTHKTFSGSKQ